MTTNAEAACFYAALMLADDDIDITADKINAILKAASVKFVEPFMPGLFANVLNGRNIKELLASMTTPGGDSAATVPSAAAPAAAAPAEAPKAEKEVKKPEPESESDEDMGFDLFG